MLSRQWLAGVAMSVAVLFPAAGNAAITEDTFQLRTTGDLVELCSAAPSDPMGTAALNFCHGFALGVYRVLEETNAASERTGKMFCMPDPPLPSRNQAINDFLQWAKATPAVMSQNPADGVTSYLASKYPCKRGK
jgi:Rap1a immunity proteins